MKFKMKSLIDLVGQCVIIFLLVVIGLFCFGPGDAGAEEMFVIPHDEKYAPDGLELEYDNLFIFSTSQSPDGRATTWIGLDIGAVWRFFKPEKKFEDKTLREQLAHIFGHEGHYWAAIDGVPTAPGESANADIIMDTKRIRLGITEAELAMMRHQDKERSNAERGGYQFGNNVPTYTGALVAAGAGAWGYNSYKSSGGGGGKGGGDNNKTVTITGDFNTVVDNGSGSGSSQTGGSSNQDDNPSTTTTTTP